MNGLAFLIPDANFDGSPLGKVTSAKTYEELAEEKIASYISLVGNTYKTQLVTMVAGLMREGIWENVFCLSPMIGSNASQLTYNIADSTKPLLTLPNATVGTNKISFANNVAQSAIELDSTNCFDYTLVENLCLYTSLKWVKRSLASTSVNTGIGEGISSISFGGLLNGINYGDSVFTDHSLVDGQAMSICANGSSIKTLAIIDGDEYEFGKCINTANYRVAQSRYIGGKPTVDTSGSSSGNLFNGEIYMFALANLNTEEKFRKFEEILSAFSDSVIR